MGVILGTKPLSDSADAVYGLSGTIEPTRPWHAYRVGLLLVAAIMLVLPLLYLGLIALAATAVWWHLTANTWILTGRSHSLWKLIGYVGPAVAGLILTFFMVKPVLARPAARVDPLPILPEDQPVLFRFIAEICRLVGAPIPNRIQVDCQVNASASFSSMARAVIKPRLVLTIGLPLAAGLTLRQFGGVMAHEFGHFAQRGGMRLTFIVRSINAWFSRVVYERDAWDEKLEQWSRDWDWRIGIMLIMARISVWCSRRVLAALMMLGHGISCFMLRQMEYDADSYEIKLVGSEAFIATSTRMRELNVAAQLGHRELYDSWMRKRLPSNLPAFMLRQGERIPAEVLAQIRKAPEVATGKFDTHPADADRVRAAERAKSAGILVGGDVPATILFRDFNALSTAVTRHHYEHDLGLSLESATLVDTDDAMKASLDRKGHQRSVEAVFGERISWLRLDQLRSVDVEAMAEPQLIDAIRTARDAMINADASLAEKYRRLERLEHARDLASGAQALFEAGFKKLQGTDFGLTDVTPKGAEQAAARALEEQAHLAREIAVFESHAARRLACARILVSRSTLGLDSTVREALQLNAARAQRALDSLADSWKNLNELRRLTVVFGLLSENAQNSPDPDVARARADRTADEICVRLQRIHKAIGETPSPDLDAPHGGLLTALLGFDQPGDSEVKAPFIVHRAITIGFELIGRLAEIALQVETALDGGAGSCARSSIAG